ncbi:MAG: isoamylase early set domain-containing protein [Candidatus Promineifilaceae bacterium]
MVSKKFFKTKEECEVTFEYDDENVESVELVTSANNWEPVEMPKRKKDGVFYTRVRYPNNTEVQFRYLLDGGTWVNDPEADAYVPNEHGSQNSVVSTAPVS